MLPLTGSLYVKGKVADTQHLLVNIGTDYYVEVGGAGAPVRWAGIGGVMALLSSPKPSGCVQLAACCGHPSDLCLASAR
jgi:hypothetical protein